MLIECIDCLNKVLIRQNTLCPACNSDQRIKSKKTKDDILLDQECRIIQDKINYRKKKTPELITLGAIVFGLCFFILIGMLIAERIVGNILLGILFVVLLWTKRIKLKRDIKEIEYFWRIRRTELKNRK